MIQNVSRIFLLSVFLLGTPSVTQADDPAIARCQQLAQTLNSWADTVLAYHVDPPVRQQMLLAAVRSAYTKAAVPLSAKERREFSDSTDHDQLLEHVAMLLHRLEQETNLTATDIEGITLRGLLHSFPGTTRLVTNEELEVEIGSRRFESNTYVGIGIALNHDEQLGYSVTDVFPQAPGHVAGLKPDDVIEQVDGTAVREMEFTKVIQLLRGPEHSTLELVVRRPDEADTRAISIVRRIVPREFVSDFEVVAERIAYASVQRVAASTVHELRQLEQRARRDGCQALLLDMRGCQESDVHYAVTLADTLLDNQPMGRLWTASKVTEFRASPEALFSDWPLAVLFDSHTSDHAAWVAESMRSVGRAKVFSVDTQRTYFVYEPVAAPSGEHFIFMATGRLLTAEAEELTLPGGMLASNRGTNNIVLHRDLASRRDLAVQPAQMKAEAVQWLRGQLASE